MREIKFRGKDIATGEWRYGSLLVHKTHAPHIVDCTGRFPDVKIYTVKSDTVGEFTGLKDKNGVEIYEGDVVMSQFSEKPFGAVTWHTDGYFFIDFSFGEWQYYGNGFVPLGEIMKRKIDGKSHQFGVIGNIHDNPELLK